MKSYTLIEPFAGLGAYSLHAIATQPRIGGRAKPPYSRMGSKAGFAPLVSKAFGFHRRPLAGVWLNDTCSVCQALWLSYASADFRDAVAARISAMVPCRLCLPETVEEALRGEVSPTPETVTGREGCEECNGTGVADARQLWERLRSTPVPAFGVELGAVGAFLQARAFSQAPVGDVHGIWKMQKGDAMGVVGFKSEEMGGVAVDALASRFSSLPSGAADFAAVGAFLQSRQYLSKPVNASDVWEGTDGTFQPEYWFQRETSPHNRMGPVQKARGLPALPRHTVANYVSSLPPGVADFAAVGAFLQSRSFSLLPVGVDGAGWGKMGFKPEVEENCYAPKTPRHTLASRFSTLPGPHNIPITMTGVDASTILPTGDASDCLVILDPPYEATTGYASDSPRHAVLTLARAWHDAGALVLIHEAVGLDAELGAPWESRPAGVLRKGGASNFWRGGEEREWLTFNKAPVWWPAQQTTLF